MTRGRTPAMIRALIVAISPVARAGLANLLEGPDVRIAGSFANLAALADHSDELAADLLIVDASASHTSSVLDDLSALELAADLPVLLLVDDSPPDWSRTALRAGIRAILPIDASREQLLAAVRAVSNGLVVLRADDVPDLLPSPAPASRPLGELTEALTNREREVLQMLSNGLANKEIAARLNISEHTAKFHVASILGKLGAATRTEAVALGIRRGLILL